MATRSGGQSQEHSKRGGTDRGGSATVGAAKERPQAQQGRRGATPKAKVRPASARAQAAATAGFPPVVPVESLGSVGHVRCGLTVLPPLVLPQVDAVVSEVPLDDARRMAMSSRELGMDVDIPALRAVTVDAPHVVRAPEVNPAGWRWIVFTSLREAHPRAKASRKPSAETAGRAAAAVVGAAARHGATSVSMPLLGSGTLGLDAAAVADAVVAGVRSALRDLGPDASLREVVFVAEGDDSAAHVRAAWQGYRAQPFANDRPGGPDLLGLRDEVEALADMLLLREVRPPLAVGVLGGWGSGKSFVMHLMRERLNEIRAATLAEDECWEGDRVSPFVGHIYPVEFNAWTYARADLWAALMQTTLSELDRQLGLERRIVAVGRDLLDGAGWRRLHELPEELHKLYEQTPAAAGAEDLFATLNLVHAEERKELDAKQAALGELRAQEAQAERDIEAWVDSTLAVEVDTARWQPFRDVLARIVDVSGDEVQKWLAKEAPETRTMIHDVGVTTQDARQVAAAVRALRPPDRAVARSILTRHRVAAVAFVVASLVAPLVLVAVRNWLGEFTLSAGVIAAVTGAASFARLAAAWASVGRRFADQLTAWQQSVEDDIRRVEETRTEKVEATKRSDPRLTAVREEIARTEHDVERLRQRVGLVGEFRSVADLVKERLEAGTYQERLGVMQQISEDLASISRSMTAPDRDVAQGPRRKLFPRGPARVVLFIDDLDRCPPPKVVEVLEAVQLLLSTNLFVVVVAIDVRYVTKALEKVYEGVLDADGEPSGIDYLEKIIQIPYRTRALTAKASARFLAGQLRVAADDAAAAAGDYPDVPLGATSTGDEPSAATTRSAAAIARDLLFTPAEVAAVSACCAVLRVSPRAAKRVANVAKLFRMVWARRGRPAPTLDETATVAVLVALASTHPEVQRDALAHLDTLVRATPVPETGLTDALLSLPLPPATAGARWRAQHEAWRDAVEAVGRETVGEGPTASGLGSASLADVTRAVEFVAAFCFVADVSAG